MRKRLDYVAFQADLSSTGLYGFYSVGENARGNRRVISIAASDLLGLKFAYFRHRLWLEERVAISSLHRPFPTSDTLVVRARLLQVDDGGGCKIVGLSS